jgi:hypothetical protein
MKDWTSTGKSGIMGNSRKPKSTEGEKYTSQKLQKEKVIGCKPSCAPLVEVRP